MSHDFIARPTKASLKHRRAQLDRDRLRLLDQLEEEQLLDVSALPPRGRFRIPLVSAPDKKTRKL